MNVSCVPGSEKTHEKFVKVSKGCANIAERKKSETDRTMHYGVLAYNTVVIDCTIVCGCVVCFRV